VDKAILPQNPVFGFSGRVGRVLFSENGGVQVNETLHKRAKNCIILCIFVPLAGISLEKLIQKKFLDSFKPKDYG
jgi:hypothetical protein